jgi:hypothetical protein
MGIPFLDLLDTPARTTLDRLFLSTGLRCNLFEKNGATPSTYTWERILDTQGH